MADALLVIVATLFYGALHSLLASHASKRWARSVLGASADRFYRLGFNAIAVASFLPILALLLWKPGSVLYRPPFPWSVLALVGQMAAAVFLVFGLLQSDAWSFLGLRQLSGSGPASSPLVVTGLYRWVRHPLYSAGLAFIWLTPLMTSSLLALNLALTAYIVVGSRLEERRLLAEFGEAYRDYQRRVPSLLPWRMPLHR